MLNQETINRITRAEAAAQLARRVIRIRTTATPTDDLNIVNALILGLQAVLEALHELEQGK